MNHSPFRSPLIGAHACMLTTGILLGLVGCSEPAGTITQAPCSASHLAQTPTPQRRVANAFDDTQAKDLAGVSRRVREFVEHKIGQQNRRLLVLGLRPARVQIDIHPTEEWSCQRKTLLATRIAQAVADEIGQLDDVTVVSPRHALDSTTSKLSIDVVNDFDATAFFDSISLRFLLELTDLNACEYADSVTSEGVARVILPKRNAQSVIVSTRKDGQAVISFETQGDSWFLVPVDSQVSVQYQGRSWNFYAGLQNVWRLTPEAAHLTDALLEARPSPETPRHPASLPLPPTIETSASIRPGMSLSITSPGDNAVVQRYTPVSGSATGLDGCRVELFVTPVFDIEYRQDGSYAIKNGTWQSPRAIFGRTQDSGQQFLLQARARSTDGTIVESTVLTVTRR